jgi:cold shock CspA family protein
MQGAVAEFDDRRGYGTIRADDGTEYFLHCTRIADGTRTIDAGAAVIFDVVPGHAGRYEAANVVKR